MNLADRLCVGELWGLAYQFLFCFLEQKLVGFNLSPGHSVFDLFHSPASI